MQQVARVVMRCAQQPVSQQAVAVHLARLLVQVARVGRLLAQVDIVAEVVAVMAPITHLVSVLAVV